MTNGTFTVRFDPTQYPFPDPIPSTGTMRWLGQVRAVLGFDPDRQRVARQGVDWYAPSTGAGWPCSVSGPGLLTVTVDGANSRLNQGEWLVLRHAVYSYDGINLQNVSGATVVDVVQWSAAGMGFYVGGSTDVTLRRCGIRRRPGRPMSITADASHFSEVSGTVHLDGVHFEGQGDDGVNVHGVFHDVRAAESGTRLQLGSRPAGDISELHIGGQYEFRNRRNWSVEAEGVLVAAPGTVPAPPGSWAPEYQLAEFEWKRGQGPVSQYAVLTDVSRQPSVLIENSYFANNRARGTLVKTSDVVIRNNVYNGTMDHCIQAFPDGCYWFESNGFRNWTVANNTLSGCSVFASV